MKWYLYIICIALIVSGVFCGIGLYEQLTAESYVNGSIDIENQFSMETFKYSNSSIVLYDDLYSDIYTYEIDLLKVEDFNGEDNKYQLLINDYILTDTEINAGSIDSNMGLDFYSTEGEIVCSAVMHVSIDFLSNKTTLTLTTIGGQQASFLEQYFEDNGIRIKINQILGGND